MKTTELLSYLDKLIIDGEILIKEQFEVATSSFHNEHFVPLEKYRRWYGNCCVLKTKMGKALAPWEEALAVHMPNKSIVILQLLGTVRSIRDAIEGGHLTSFTDIVISETFGNLLEQSEYLLEKGYFLAAGVIGRAVLEEDLRHICQVNSYMPEKDKPTLSDFNSSLYKAQYYDKIEYKLIDSLIAIGNDCAHAKDTISQERVSHLLEQLRAVLPRINKK